MGYGALYPRTLLLDKVNSTLNPYRKKNKYELKNNKSYVRGQPSKEVSLVAQSVLRLRLFLRIRTANYHRSKHKNGIIKI